MKDLYLKFPDEATATPLLYTFEEIELPAVEEDSEPTTQEIKIPKFQNIDVIGVIYNNDAVYNSDMELVTPPTALDGYHVNIRLLDDESDESLIEYVLEPKNPVRVWA